MSLKVVDAHLVAFLGWRPAQREKAIGRGLCLGAEFQLGAARSLC